METNAVAPLFLLLFSVIALIIPQSKGTVVGRAPQMQGSHRTFVYGHKSFSPTDGAALLSLSPGAHGSSLRSSHQNNLHSSLPSSSSSSSSSFSAKGFFFSSRNTRHFYLPSLKINSHKSSSSSVDGQKARHLHHLVSHRNQPLPSASLTTPSILPTPEAFRSALNGMDDLAFGTSTVYSNTLAGPGLAAMFTPPPSFPNNNIKPSFTNTTSTNVTVIRGRMAELKCAVDNLGTKSVSWVRHEDIHVLTVGRITFTNDGRFVAHNTPGSNVWSLRIKFPQPRDSGKYECQVSIRPPLARVVQLNVVEPQAVIPPGRELFVDRGSPLNITCVIPDSPEPPRNVFWYHQNKMVSFDGSREGVSVSTEKGDVTTSILRIPDVQLKDSGVYICSPEGMKEASVTVTVLRGELPQAMQTGSTCRACFGSHILLLVTVLCLVVEPYIVSPCLALVISAPR